MFCLDLTGYNARSKYWARFNEVKKVNCPCRMCLVRVKCQNKNIKMCEERIKFNRILLSLTDYSLYGRRI